MTRFRPGDIVLVQFPFTDLRAVKRRPALILNSMSFSARFGDVIVMAMTSQTQSDNQLRLAKWHDAGLPKPTWLKPIIGTIAASLIDRRLGRLQSADIPRARLAIRRAIAREFLM